MNKEQRAKVYNIDNTSRELSIRCFSCDLSKTIMWPFSRFPSLGLIVKFINLVLQLIIIEKNNNFGDSNDETNLRKCTTGMDLVYPSSGPPLGNAIAAGFG